KLLELFLRNRGVVLDRNAIFDACWGDRFFPASRTPDQHIAKLRKPIPGSCRAGWRGRHRGRLQRHVVTRRTPAPWPSPAPPAIASRSPVHTSAGRTGFTSGGFSSTTRSPGFPSAPSRANETSEVAPGGAFEKGLPLTATPYSDPVQTSAGK